MTLEIYMKSGNKIKCNAEKWDASYKGNEITHFSITRKPKAFFRPKKQLIVETMDLSQIEAIVEVK